MRCRVRTFSISKKLGFELCTECEQRVYLILQDGEAFAGRQRQHPADQRKIDAILAVLWFHEFSLLPRCRQSVTLPDSSAQMRHESAQVRSDGHSFMPRFACFAYEARK